MASRHGRSPDTESEPPRRNLETAFPDGDEPHHKTPGPTGRLFSSPFRQNRFLRSREGPLPAAAKADREGKAAMVG